MPNALAQETSPYLLAHANNPVDWLPWGPVALERARELDRPLLVSIGYAACHWCHVMERESFEDPRTAALMNEHFVAVKVDREERPDVDGVYMEAVQAITGQGGWPLKVFLTPDQQPFFGGTYWPPVRRHGMPSFQEVLEAVAGLWRERREEVRAAPQQSSPASGAARGARARGGAARREEVLAHALASLEQSFDARNGGFGGAPKFPPHCEFAAASCRRGARRARAHGAGDAARDGARGHQRPGRRGLRALRRRCDLDGPPLREDALRQRAPRARVPARVAGLR